MITQKYEFTGETKDHFGTTLRRIRRLSDGLVGGWIEKEDNLSQYGICFVSGNARVFGDARVSGDARVYGNARVYGDAWVYENARVYGDAWVSGNAVLTMASDLVCLSGLSFHVTVTPQNCVIGCQIRTHAEWKKVTLSEAVRMGLPKEEYHHLRLILLSTFYRLAAR